MTSNPPGEPDSYRRREGERDPDRETRVTVHGWEDEESTCDAVVRVVAAVTGTSPEQLPPLYEVVDPDALDRLFAPVPSSARESRRGRLAFEFGGCDVLVRSNGEVVASARREDA